MTELTPKTFDAMVKGRPPAAERPVWTLPRIGEEIGIGVDGVRALMREPGCPIKRRAGRYYCYMSALHSWLKQGEAA